mmetsp:Transcript_96137/g.170613  ORF Transcript_96137/g.170613 Transcript_96137/m.170613 type:complete len:202 (+) Transcript_96137:198-803(+)
MSHKRIDYGAELQVIKAIFVTEGIAQSIHFMFCERKSHEVHDTKHRGPTNPSDWCTLAPVIEGAIKFQAARLCLAADSCQQLIQASHRPEATLLVGLVDRLCCLSQSAIHIIAEWFVLEEALWIGVIIPWTFALVSFLQDLKLSLWKVYPHDAQRGPELTWCDNPLAQSIEVHKTIVQSHTSLLYNALDLANHLLMSWQSS